MKRRSGVLSILVVVAWGLALGGAPAMAAQGTLAVLPALNTVDPAEIFDLEITVAAGSDSFNAYEIEIEFDPALLTFIQMSPLSLQEGSLMKAACGSRFHLFNETGGIITVTHSLLCAGVLVAGPGVVYQLRFQAGATNGLTTVKFNSARVVRAGIPFAQVTTEDAVIQIGDVTGVPDGDPTSAQMFAPPFPNPSTGPVHFSLSHLAGGRLALEVISVDGRRIRSLLERQTSAEAVEVVWDGRDDHGRRVGHGVYFVRLLNGPRSVVRRVVLIRP